MKNSEVNWEVYASAYDLMAKNNPAYQNIIEIVRQESTKWPMNAGDIIVDLGAGTGNFSTLLSSLFPQATILHIDSCREMNASALDKASSLQCLNFQIRERDISILDFPAGSLSAVVCVHSLYAFPNAIEMISKIHQWLRPGGHLFACDLGRPMNVIDWARYIFRESYKRDGLLVTLHRFWKGRIVAKQNRKILASQKNGAYWMHELPDYRNAFEQSGFSIIHSQECYRGYSDLVVAIKS